MAEGWRIPRVAPDPEFRRSLEEEAAELGPDKLYQQLVEVDPEAGQHIDPRNTRRVIRALEVHRSTQIPFSQFQQKQTPPFKILMLGLSAERPYLYDKINLRIDKMIDQGLIEEVKNLLKMGYDSDLPAMSGIGYRQIAMFLRGETTLPAAVQQVKSETHRYVRQQYNWFQMEDDRIHWFDIQKEPNSEITKIVDKFTGG